MAGAVGRWRRTNRHLPVMLLCSLFASSDAISQSNAPDRSSRSTLSSPGGHVRQPKPLSRTDERALQPLDVFKECSVCPEMIVVPSGEFIMGAPESEAGSQRSERPQHKVTIVAPFAVGRFAISFEEWDACVADHDCRNYRPPDRWGREQQPVINLWWDDATAYVRWLSDKTGKSYRLLSEPQREYVTRAGTTTPFWWGSSVSTDQANYDGTFAYPALGNGLSGVYRGKTVPIGSFLPNPWGLYRVQGNLYEWVEDCWHDNYGGAPTDGSPWTTVDCKRHILRGGAWNFAPWQLRSADRGSVASAADLLPVGMRVARAINR
jgi:formylglycine-generating enzyme required for sulfatase activity